MLSHTADVFSVGYFIAVDDVGVRQCLYELELLVDPHGVVCNATILIRIPGVRVPEGSRLI